MPKPNGVPCVSQCSTTMSSYGTPSSSATIWAKVVSWPCPCGSEPVVTTTLPVRWTRRSRFPRVRRPSLRRPVRSTSRARRRRPRRTWRGRCRAAWCRCWRDCCLLLAKAAVADHLERLVERRLVVAAVVRQHADAGVVGEIVRLDEVLAPHLGRIDPDLARDQIDDALDHEGRLGPARAAVGVDHRRVGVDAVHVDEDVGDLVHTRDHAPVERGRDTAARSSRGRRRDWRRYAPSAPVILPSACRRSRCR